MKMFDWFWNWLTRKLKLDILNREHNKLCYKVDMLGGSFRACYTELEAKISQIPNVQYRNEFIRNEFIQAAYQPWRPIEEVKKD
jgi:hypothetical protein